MKTIDTVISVMKQSAFLHLIDQERARVNRNGSHFTLVLLQLSNGFARNRDVQTDVFNTIMERIRTIDQLGVYDDDHIGLLLPQTSRDGASRIIDDLWCNKIVTANISSYRLYCYP